MYQLKHKVSSFVAVTVRAHEDRFPGRVNWKGWDPLCTYTKR
jgi:hypothetical protein